MTKEYEAQKCVRAGCFHRLWEHNFTLICTIQGCECRQYLETRESMPSDKKTEVLP